MNACDHPWWIEGDYTDATCKACGVPGWYCPACSPDPDDDADEDCATCGGSGYVVVHELIARLTRELEEARAKVETVTSTAMRLLSGGCDADHAGTMGLAEFAHAGGGACGVCLTRELEEAREREQRMWTVLHSVEWQGREDDDGWRQCPECWAWGSEGHTPDCALRAILATPPAAGGGDGG